MTDTVCLQYCRKGCQRENFKSFILSQKTIKQPLCAFITQANNQAFLCTWKKIRSKKKDQVFLNNNSGFCQGKLKSKPVIYRSVYIIRFQKSCSRFFAISLRERLEKKPEIVLSTNNMATVSRSVKLDNDENVINNNRHLHHRRTNAIS